jgi:uncharacterized protein YbcC (UPF0753/DUF2309 family)
VSATKPAFAATRNQLEEAIEAACRRIAPNWPLDRFIAVNPWWGWIDQPFHEAGQTLARLAGTRFWMSPEYYRRAWRNGEIRREHLQQALEECGANLSEDAILAGLESSDPTPPPAPLLSDALDAVRDLAHEPAWRDTITHQVSQFCAAWFDRNQADWYPTPKNGFYNMWRQTMIHDHSVALLMRAPNIRQRARLLPEEPQTAIAQAVERHRLTTDMAADWLCALLLRINGWAAWCAYLKWEARLRHRDDHHLVELLAIRASWESLLDDGRREEDSVWARWWESWQRNLRAHATAPPSVFAIWQRAEEIAYQRALAGSLAAVNCPPPAEPPAFQAVFCLDVRAEVFRRSLERVASNVQTIGCAGFFGLPVQYSPLGAAMTQPQLPGLMAPTLEVTESLGDAEADEQLRQRRRSRLALWDVWQTFTRLPGSAFTLVESLGLGYLGKMIGRSVRQQPGAPTSSFHDQGLRQPEKQRLRPCLVWPAPATAESRAALAAQVLRAMNLTAGFGRLVLLAGHGSQSANNPHAAGLDCGACGGQTGDLNARVLAGLLNSPEVRQALAQQGIVIPETTHFLPALHNTATDEVMLFDTDLIPASHAADAAELQNVLSRAGELARAERAPSLKLEHLTTDPNALLEAIRARTGDWRQTRPEWGLANNAAFLIARRARSRGVNLQGRSFLHEYDWRADPDGATLELIMTGPVVVTHWINMQYFASAVDNTRFGSGNKVLHNVVGGCIGVFEGNNGDLRIGLPLQSLHDGERWMHAPLRLSLFIEAPRAAIEKVIGKQELVRRLIDHQWLYVFRLAEDCIEQRVAGEWRYGLTTG